MNKNCQLDRQTQSYSTANALDFSEVPLHRQSEEEARSRAIVMTIRSLYRLAFADVLLPAFLK